MKVEEVSTYSFRIEDQQGIRMLVSTKEDLGLVIIRIAKVNGMQVFDEPDALKMLLPRGTFNRLLKVFERVEGEETALEERNFHKAMNQMTIDEVIS